MTNGTKYLLAFAVIAGLFGLAAFFGFTPFGVIVEQQLAGSPAGTTFSNAKFAGVAINLASPGANGTSTSVLNTDAGDRYINTIKVGCEGVGTSRTAYSGTGLDVLTLRIATSSTSAPAANNNANPVGGGPLTVATSSTYFMEASTTASTAVPNVGTSAISNIWATGSYLTFTANATNTAACTVGVDYFAS